MPQPKVPTHPHRHLQRALGEHRSTYVHLAQRAAELAQARETARQELRQAIQADTGQEATPGGDQTAPT